MARNEMLRGAVLSDGGQPSFDRYRRAVGTEW